MDFSVTKKLKTVEKSVDDSILLSTLIRFYSCPQLPDLAQRLGENVWKDFE